MIFPLGCSLPIDALSSCVQDTRHHQGRRSMIHLRSSGRSGTLAYLPKLVLMFSMYFAHYSTQPL